MFPISKNQGDFLHYFNPVKSRAGHISRCPLKRALSVDPLISGSKLIFSLKNVNLAEEKHGFKALISTLTE
jgi:hypothetical protein